MVIVAPRLRCVLNRLTKLGVHVSALVLAALVLVHLSTRIPANLLYEAVGAVVVVAATSIWLALFNSGRLALPEAEVRWDAHGFSYRRFEYVATIPWQDFRGFRLTWELPPRAKVTRQQGSPVLIDLFSFTRAQRQLLLEELEGRQGAA